MIRKLMPYAKGYGFVSLMASITVIFEVVLEVYIPFLMADIIDIGIPSGDVNFIVRRGLVMILMACLALLMGAISARFAVVGSTGFSTNLRAELFNRVQGFSFANVDKFSTSSLITRLTTDVTNVQQSYMMIIRLLVRSPVMLISATVMALRINRELSVVFAYALPILIFLVYLLSKFAFPRFKEMLKRYDEMNAQVQEDLIAIRVVKAFVREKHEDTRFIGAADAVRRAQRKAEKMIVWTMPIAQYVLYLCMIAVCYLGGRLIVAGDMLSGDLAGFISYIAQVLNAVLMITMVYVSLVMTRASISRIVEVLDEQNAIGETGANPSATVREGAIEFEHVNFSYANDRDNLPLSDINFRIEPGETVGIIGGTGSAKTTLVQLIPRLYDVLSGSVKVDGRDVREYTLDHLRSSVAMVLQKNVLFSGSIRDNLRWGDMGASDEEIEAAARSASADGFIRSFPNGYDTELGQGGVNVSGGQKQRLCIARALLKKPKVILLDDSTSAVDTATDASIRKALKEDLKGTTTLIIAQRIASIMDSDRIIVLNDGRVHDIGTHDELLSRNEIYREVYHSQQKGVA